MDYFIYSLFRPTAGARSMFPQEITPRGLSRRLNKLRQDYPTWPDWHSPATQDSLVENMARRFHADLIPVLVALVDHFKGAEQDSVQKAIWKAVGMDHPMAKRRAFVAPEGVPPQSLLERLIRFSAFDTDDLSTAAPRLNDPLPLAPGQDAWRRLAMGAVRARQGDRPGEVNHWARLIQAHRLAQTDSAWADLDDLFTRWPELIHARFENQDDLPILLQPMSSDESDQRSFDLFVKHGGDPRQSACVRANERSMRSAKRLAIDWNRRIPNGALQQAPLWVVLAHQGHEAALAWGKTHAPDQLPRLLHMQDLHKVSDFQGNIETLERALTSSLAWTEPDSLIRPSPQAPGERHPLWAAVRNDQRLLERNYQDEYHAPSVMRALHKRVDLRQAMDEEGANLWWALMERHGLADRAFRTLSNKKTNVPCQPDRLGRGLFHRHPDIAQVFKNGAILGQEAQVTLDNLKENPVWQALQANPTGFFGQGEEAQDQTAQTLWDFAEKRRWYVPSQDAMQDMHNAKLMLMAFQDIEPETLCAKWRLMVAVILVTACRWGELTQEDLEPWVCLPETAGIAEDHPVLVHAREESPVLKSALMAARALPLMPSDRARARLRQRT